MPRNNNTPPVEHTFPSTTFVWKRVKILDPSGSSGQRRFAAPSEPLRARDPRKPITVQLEYRGGPEAKWRVRARGRTWNFPGVTALHDVMAAVNATLQRMEQ